ncbi:exosome complex protein Rrp4 [Candidatus Woesearchaeota archaeon]|nr:exosome complex protein Rrp4 [Candidatus Woesearchaeota archaeon]MBW3021903.1 exosome complex protein Rrp4 [Candidatus Woesearchaeota archaeon]
MGNLIAKEKSVVVPGEVLADGMDYIPGVNTYRLGDKVLASKLGLVSVEGRAIKLIPLSGKYTPKKGDTIIGKVVDVLFSGWRIETNSAYSAMLSLKDATSEFIAKGADLRKYYDFGDYVVAKITNVTSQKLIDLTMKGPGLRKLAGGRVIEVSPHKVPRIIGKKGSMVSMIKDATGCRIVVGQNGLVWIQGDDPVKELLAIKTIRKIEAEAHVSGLTDVIKAFLENKGE